MNSLDSPFLEGGTVAVCARNAAAMSVVRVLALLLMVAAAAAARAAAAGGGGGCMAVRFSNNRVYAACSDLPHLGASVHWTYDAAAASLSVAFVAAPPSAGGWVAWGLNPTSHGMIGAQALVAAPKGGGAYAVETYSISGYALGSPGPIAYQTSDLAANFGADGRVQMFGKLKLQNGTGEVNQVWQAGPVSSGSIRAHAMLADNTAAKGKLNLVTGASTAAGGGGSLVRKKNTFKSADPAWFYLLVLVACLLFGYGVRLIALGTLQIFALWGHKYRLYWYVVGYTMMILANIMALKGMSISNVEQKWKTRFIIASTFVGCIPVISEAVTRSIVLKRRRSENKS